jgi:TolB-like protein/DNA-binding winged helix-turn-helix (wHTH) protein/tetratricopeptide (TPR) repeat protein
MRFGPFEADVRTGDLRKGGLPLRLRGRPFEILTLLLAQPGELVTRDELREKLWSADTFVDFDHGLNTAVNRLREALGDSAESPRFVETVPRRGYRFVAPVINLDAPPPPPAAPAPSPPVLPEQRVAPQPVKPTRRRGPLVVGLALAALMAVGSLLALRGREAHRPTDGPTRLAVLPFRNVGGDPTQDYFADGLTDELIADLSQVSALRIISRTSVMPYKAASKRLPEIAKELNVDTVVEGSVLRSGDKVRITARLVDASADHNLWAESYERDIADILALQREVARSITIGVRVTVTPQEQARLEQPARVDPKAYEAYLQGRFAWQTMTTDGLHKGIESMDRAIAIDPSYAPAYSGLAYCWWIMGSAGYEVAPQSETAPKAKAAALKALELDPSLGSAAVTLGMVEIDHDWDFAHGEARIREAISRSPSLADARISYSSYLAAMGRSDEAIAEAERGLDLDPLSVVASQTLGYRLYYGGQYDRALIEFRKALQLDPHSFVARIGLAQAHWQKGERRPALLEGERALRDSAESPWVLGWLGFAWSVDGQPAKGREVLATLASRSKRGYISPFYRAMVDVGLGDHDGAMSALEEAFKDRSGWLVFLNVEPEFERLRSDPRFLALLRRAGHAAPGPANSRTSARS